MNPLQQQIEALLPEERIETNDAISKSCPMCFNKALSLTKQSLPAIIELIEKDTRERIINELESNPNEDGSTSPSIQHWIEKKQSQLRKLSTNQSLSQTTGE